MPDQWDPFTGGDAPKGETPATPAAAPTIKAAPKAAVAPKAAAAPKPVVTPSGRVNMPIQGDKYTPTTVGQLQTSMRGFGTNNPSIAPSESLSLNDLIAGRTVHRKDPRPGHETFEETRHARTDQPAAELAKQFGQPLPSSWKEAKQQLMAPTVGDEWKADEAAVNYVGGALQAPVDYLFGRPIEMMTGGRVSEQMGGDIVMALSPVGEWALAERGAELGAKTLGISKDMYRHVSEQRGIQEGRLAADSKAIADEAARTAKARRNAARKLIHQPDRERLGGMGGDVGSGGLKSKEAREKAEYWRKANVGGEPTLADVLPRSAVELVRKAGGKLDSAREKLQEHLDRTMAFVTQAGRRRALLEAPNPAESTEARMQRLRKAQKNEAATIYRGPWSFRFQADDQLFDILFTGWKQGPRMVRLALEDAGARLFKSNEDKDGIEVREESLRQIQDLKALDKYLTELGTYEQKVREFDRLVEEERTKRQGLSPEQMEFELSDLMKKDPRLKGPPARPSISAGALDRIHHIAEREAKAMERNNPTRAGGIGERADLIDMYLQRVPGLPKARAAFRAKQVQMDLLDMKYNIGRMDPRKFGEYLRGYWSNQTHLTKAQRNEVINAVMSELAESYGSASGRVEIPDKTTLEANIRQLLADDKNPERADLFIDAINMMDETLEIAKRMAKGPMNASERENLDVRSTTMQMMVAWSIKRANSVIWLGSRLLDRYIAMTGPEEAATLVNWAVQRGMKVEDTLQEILDAAGTDPTLADRRDAILKKLGETADAAGRSRVPEAVMQILLKSRRMDPTLPVSHEPGTPPPAGEGSDQPTTEDLTAPGGPPPPLGDPKSYQGDPFTGGDAPAGAPAAEPGAAPASEEEGDVDTSVPTDMNGLLDKIAFLEGSGDDAVSPAGAIGKYQIWPKTARGYHLDVNRLMDPAYNRYAASVILADMYNRFNGDLGATLAEYNGGRGRQWLESGRNPAVLRPETRKYLYRAGIITAEQMGQPDDREYGGFTGFGEPEEAEEGPPLPDYGMPYGDEPQVPDYGAL